jgi:hypothetical protein
MDRKPNVFPTKEQREAADERTKQAAFEAEKIAVTSEIYTNSMAPQDTPNGHADAVEMMRRRTEQQLNMHKEQGVVQDPSLAERPAPVFLTKYEQEVLEIRKKSEEQMRIRDERLSNNLNQTQSYQQQYEQASVKKTIQTEPISQNITNTPVQKTIMQPQNYGQNPTSIDPYIIELSQPNYNSPFDVIPLPSQGKLYRSKKPNIRVSFMTTADENILTSPNLLQSGQFLDILINRKVLESDLRYKDLHIGDRNAVMIWLRATGYGEMYPVTILDENNEPFDTEINLNELKMKPLGSEPDAEGFFDYQFSLSKAFIKFKLLTCGDIDEIETLVEKEKEAGVPVNNSSTYMIERSIVELNGSRDRNAIREFANSMRIKDAKDFSTYIEQIESGVDLNITVRTPGGGSVSTFLPLNIKFFWPNFKL